MSSTNLNTSSNSSSGKPKLNLSRIKPDWLSSTDYFKEENDKRQIYLHHTVSHPSPVNDINTWRRLPYRIGTCILVAGKPYPKETYYEDGDIYQCFSSSHWAFHLASHGSGNQIPRKYKTRDNTRMLEKQAIGIEVCNAGWLTWENGKFYSSFRTVIPEEQVIEYVDKYRGQRFYHKYTNAQVESLRQLLEYFCDKYNIPKDYQADMWDISENALSGQPGIFTHTSVRSDKTDCHPQPELVKMLMELKGETTPPPPLASSAKAQNVMVSADSGSDDESDENANSRTADSETFSR